MTEPTILILDDDEMWMTRLYFRLTKAGFHCRETQFAEEAIKIGLNYPSIKFALIDEDLKIPPLLEEDQGWTGSDVIKELHKKRPDIEFIIISAVPVDRSGGDASILIQEESRLKRQPGVVDFIHKEEIERNPDDLFNYLKTQLNKPQLSITHEDNEPKIIVGLGLPETVFEQYCDLYQQNHSKQWRKKQIFLKDYLNELFSDYELGKSDYKPVIQENLIPKYFHKLEKAAIEKKIFLQTPIQKRLDPCDEIKPNSKSFFILEFLAQKAEQEEQVIIKESDYPTKSRSQSGIDPSIDQDKLSIEDFTYEVGSNGGKQQKQGVQIKRQPKQNSPLKVAMHRLSQKLNELNVGPASKLFYCEDGNYYPTFKTGIIIYFPKPKK